MFPANLAAAVGAEGVKPVVNVGGNNPCTIEFLNAKEPARLVVLMPITTA